jgi:eukaryotic-like serine/threonine-protein kinase
VSQQTPSIDEIFFAAMERESPEARGAYLDEVCGPDLDLRRRVERLLDAQLKVGSFLDSPAAGPTVNLLPAEVLEGPGSVIGPFKLLEQIGEGGMGIVYMAEQTQPVRRKVALKIIKPGMDTRQVIARFEAERQALAMMDHPNIAKVLDAGATESGRPYFVMELVRGIPITEYCDQNRLPINKRLDLFMQVCQAVQHAHQKGIIHRDIKPTNVLVTALDSVPLPRVIDFGIAKATGQSLTDKTLFTGFAQLIGTPLYMSPEQAELSAVDIDTKSDIYSLGVLLYELLTGTTPFDQDTFRTAALDEVRRIIREDEPPRPSTRLSGLGATLTTVSDNRQTDARMLSRSLRGELDWIVMKALEKDRRRRYETASGLARDVERYMAGDPVEAGQPSGWYRLRKFARRNRVILATTILIALSLVVGTTASVWQAILARRARADAVNQRDRARNAEADALAQRDQARQAVDDMYTDVAEDWLAQRAALQPMQQKFLQKALNYYQRFGGETSTDAKLRLKTAIAHRRVANIQEKLGHRGEAKAACRRAMGILESILADSPSDAECRCELAVSQGTLGRLMWDTGPLEAAELLMRDAIALLEKLAADVPLRAQYQSELARSYVILAADLWENGDRRGRDCEHMLRRSIALYARLASDSASVFKYRRSLARAHTELGLVLHGLNATAEERVATFRAAVEQCEKLTIDSPSVPDYRSLLAESLYNLGICLMEIDRLSEADEVFRRAIGIEEKLADDSPFVPFYKRRLAMSCGRLGLLLFWLGRLKEGEPHLRRAVGLCANLFASSPTDRDNRVLYVIQRYRLAELLAQAGRTLEAEQEYRGSIALVEKVAREHPSVEAYQRELASAKQQVGDFLRRAGRQSEAEQEYRQAISLLTRLAGAESANMLAWSVANCPDLRLRDPQMAVAAAQKAVELRPQAWAYWNTLGAARYRAGEWKSAAEALEKAKELCTGDQESGWFFHAMACWRQGEKEKARLSYAKGIKRIETNNAHREELSRFRAEAAALLGVAEYSNSTKAKEESSTRSSKP